MVVATLWAAMSLGRNNSRSRGGRDAFMVCLDTFRKQIQKFKNRNNAACTRLLAALTSAEICLSVYYNVHILPNYQCETQGLTRPWNNFCKFLAFFARGNLWSSWKYF